MNLNTLNQNEIHAQLDMFLSLQLERYSSLKSILHTDYQQIDDELNHERFEQSREKAISSLHKITSELIRLSEGFMLSAFTLDTTKQHTDNTSQQTEEQLGTLKPRTRKKSPTVSLHKFTSAYSGTRRFSKNQELAQDTRNEAPHPMPVIHAPYPTQVRPAPYPMPVRPAPIPRLSDLDLGDVNRGTHSHTSLLMQPSFTPTTLPNIHNVMSTGLIPVQAQPRQGLPSKPHHSESETRSTFSSFDIDRSHFLTEDGTIRKCYMEHSREYVEIPTKISVFTDC